MQPPTVYVIDDDPEVLQATERLLASAGMTVAAFHLSLKSGNPTLLADRVLPLDRFPLPW